MPSTVIIGESEAESRTVAIKDLGAGEQATVEMDDLADWATSK